MVFDDAVESPCHGTIQPIPKSMAGFNLFHMV